MLHITFSKYDCIIVHKAYYLFTCTCVSINSFHSHSHSHIYVSLASSAVLHLCPVGQYITFASQRPRLLQPLLHENMHTYPYISWRHFMTACF